MDLGVRKGESSLVAVGSVENAYDFKDLAAACDEFLDALEKKKEAEKHFEEAEKKWATFQKEWVLRAWEKRKEVKEKIDNH